MSNLLSNTLSGSVDTTTRDILRRHDESGWPGTELIQLMADLAGLMHDLGKACQAFQDRLA
ncbi:MAG: hypothetical protein ACK53K_10150, partial [Burkholderiales bacterium]